MQINPQKMNPNYPPNPMQIWHWSRGRQEFKRERGVEERERGVEERENKCSTCQGPWTLLQRSLISQKKKRLALFLNAKRLLFLQAVRSRTDGWDWKFLPNEWCLPKGGCLLEPFPL